jgi:hypothetical protein
MMQCGDSEFLKRAEDLAVAHSWLELLTMLGALGHRLRACADVWYAATAKADEQEFLLLDLLSAIAQVRQRLVGMPDAVPEVRELLGSLATAQVRVLRLRGELDETWACLDAQHVAIAHLGHDWKAVLCRTRAMAAGSATAEDVCWRLQRATALRDLIAVNLERLTRSRERIRRSERFLCVHGTPHEQGR